ncbi:TetR family transcriptional regulator [Planotetraspora phitsanulokensis]|uniref:Putative transcriptional regulatory protein n=1 Tax=Planotetraspora phitsanulokensis TaxID=575192 RepID=A0A8J3U5P1_9ACTN|nr:TetR family transcriptional regulator [Planotetraspora phitsanulokensis]GII39038.1 putative transcriptional regulatory protein [Planotetraspora phitsanulokensis]
MRERARSAEDKAQRSEDLLAAAEALALELGGVRFVTVAAVTERAGLHRTGVRRYYASKEELLLELAERGWGHWRDTIGARVAGRARLQPVDVADVLTETIASLPVFCDLLAHVPMDLEGDVDIERARRYKTNAFVAHDEIIDMLKRVSTMSASQLQSMIAATLPLASGFWQVSHPTPTLAKLYEQVPTWGHIALDFEPRLKLLLRAMAVGLAETLPASDAD